VRYSTISHTGAGILIAFGLTAGIAQPLYGERYSIHDVTIDDVSRARYNNGGGTLFDVLNNMPINVLNSVSINHVTGFTDPKSRMLVLRDPTTYPKMWGFSFTNNLVTPGTYPVSSAGGTSDCARSLYPVISLPSCFSSYAFSSNAVIAPSSNFPPSKWPAGNYFPGDVTAVQFVNYNNGNGGNYQLQPSSPFKNAASDGKDLGADVVAIQSAISGVY
jgi:hypothetical protein